MAERLRAKPVEFVVRKQTGISKEIRSTLYLGDSQETKEPGVLVFPGISQDGPIPIRLAETVSGGDVVDAIPYWKVPADLKPINALSIAYPAAAVDAWQEIHDTTLAASVIGESLAGNAIARSEVEHSDYFGNIAWLRTAGISAEQFKKGPLRELGSRAIKTLRHPDQDLFNDPGNLISGARIMRHLGFRALRQMQMGLAGGDSKSIIPILSKRLPIRSIQGKRNLFYAGDEDELSTLREHQRALEIIGTEYTELNVLHASHRSTMTVGGALDVQIVINDLLKEQPAASEKL